MIMIYVAFQREVTFRYYFKVAEYVGGFVERYGTSDDDIRFVTLRF